MDRFWFEIILFAIQLLLLYPIIHKSTYEIFRLIFIITHNKHFSFACIAVLFLPGTILHEMSHFFAAIILFLPVGEIRIMPEWHGNTIRLGKVTYAKSDFIRSVLVGIAPIFGALLFFTFLYLFHVFPSDNALFTVFMGYILFSISANMFSSKQDLVDLIYILPLLFVIGAIWYIFQIQVNFPIPDRLISQAVTILQFVNFCITISLIIHLGILAVIKSFFVFFKK